MRKKKQLPESIEGLKASDSKVIVQIFSADVVLTSDVAKVYLKFACETRLAYELVNATQIPLCAPLHVQNVILLQRGLKECLYWLMGVSTRFLPYCQD